MCRIIFILFCSISERSKSDLFTEHCAWQQIEIYLFGWTPWQISNLLLSECISYLNGHACVLRRSCSVTVIQIAADYYFSTSTTCILNVHLIAICVSFAVEVAFEKEEKKRLSAFRLVQFIAPTWHDTSWQTEILSFMLTAQQTKQITFAIISKPKINLRNRSLLEVIAVAAMCIGSSLQRVFY